MNEPGDELLEAISKLQEISTALTAEEAVEKFDQPDLEVFWRRWPDVSTWAGELWRKLNEDLAQPAEQVTDPELDEEGGEG
jgi:hypothetical protein